MVSAEVGSAPLRQAMERLGRRVRSARRLGGGDIAEAWRVDTDDGPLFFKTRADAGPRDFEVEAAGLRWLAEANAIAVAEVIDHGREPQPWLALRFVEPGAPAPDHDARLGRELAALHRFGAPSFGLDHANLVGALPQDNTPADDWPTFYGQRRLRALADRAVRTGRADASLRREIDGLVAVLADRCGPAEPPARLHGDLWAGNAIVDRRGRPVLIDPAVYGGHREIDLAMMRLFGGFSPATFAAYDEAYPLAPGWRERVPLYQAYPLLVHVCLFGGGYLGQLRSAIAAVR